MVVETLAEKHFDLAFRMLHEFDLPGYLYSTFALNFAELMLKIDAYLGTMFGSRHLYTQLLTDQFFSVVDVYAGVAASLAERKKGGQLTEFLKNIRGTIEDDEWDQVMCTMCFFVCSLQLCL